MERITKFYPAYDKRKTKQGVHGVEILFALKGEIGAVSFGVATNWHLPHVQSQYDNTDGEVGLILTMLKPYATSITYHSRTPQFEGQHYSGQLKQSKKTKNYGTKDHPLILPEMEESGTFTPCDLLDGDKCYSDGSGLNAIEYFETLRKEGDEGLFKQLENYYISTFGELK